MKISPNWLILLAGLFSLVVNHRFMAVNQELDEQQKFPYAATFCLITKNGLDLSTGPSRSFLSNIF
jgi:hypothetical protein